MKSQINKIIKIATVLFIISNSSYAATTFTWIGASNTSWTNPANWKVGSTIQSSNYPGKSTTTDIAQIGVATYTGSYQPTISSSVTFASIEFGTHNSPALTIAALKTLTLGNGLKIDASSTASITMSASSTLDISNGTINNLGTFSISNGIIQLEAGGPNITNSGTFTINGGATINATGNGNTATNIITNSGTFYAGTSNSACTIQLDDSNSILNQSTGTFYLGSTSVITYYNTNAHDCNITNTSGGTFTLQSDSYGSGSIDAIPQGKNNTVSGTFGVQRYITGGTGYRGYRLFSSPVYASTVNLNNVYSLNYLQSSLVLTGTGGTLKGFDKAGNPTIYLYRESISPLYTTFLNSNWEGISDLSTGPTYGTNDASNPSVNIPVGNGYLCFFRGNKNVASTAAETTTSYVPTSTTLTATGTLNVGTVVVKDWYNTSSTSLGYTAGNALTKGFNCVGNPYASSIDWDNFNDASSDITGTNISTTISFLNPNGSYGTYSSSTHMGTKNGTHIIPSGVGFFVQATGTSPKLTFTEGAKTTTQVTGASLFMAKTIASTNNQYLRLQVAKDSFYNEDVVLTFNKGTKSTFDDSKDSRYRLGTCKVNMNIISDDNIALAVNQLSLPKQSKAIALNVGAAADGVYQLQLNELQGIPRLYDVLLIDLYKKTTVDMRANKTYRFDIYKADTTSYGSKRFALVIQQNPGYAYHLLNFTAIKAANPSQVQLAWVTENEANYTNFTVERSTDGGKTFDVLGGPASNGQGTYSLLDKNPSNGQNLYRLKQEDVNDSIRYSNIIAIDYSNLSNNLVKNNINIYPNPATSNINLAIASSGMIATAYNIQITNSSGLVIKQATSNQPTWQSNVSDLMPGTYIVKVLNKKDNSVIGNTKFIKE